MVPPEKIFLLLVRRVCYNLNLDYTETMGVLCPNVNKWMVKDMLNNRKIRLMTKLAIYEKREGREDIKLAKYYKSDYTRLQVLKTAIAVTISFLCLVALGIIYKMEFILNNALDIDYALLGRRILGIYLGVMAVYLVVSALCYSIKYARSRKKLAKYFRMLRKLNHMYLVEDGYVQEDEEE